MNESRRRVRRFGFGRQRLQNDIDDEFEDHLQRTAEELAGQGLDPKAAREEAERRFGDLERYRAACRELGRRRQRAERWSEALHDLMQDLRYAFRTFARNPGFAAAAVVVLALGVGANVSIFSVVNAVLLRPLPLPEPQRLALLWVKNPERGWHQQVAAPANFLDWQAQTRSFEAMSAYEDFLRTATLGGQGEPEAVPSLSVGGEFFSTLGVQPVVGRLFQPHETWQTEERGVVLSERLWRRRYGADPEIVGRSVPINGEPWTVLGVAPAALRFPFQEAEIWTPMRWDPAKREKLWFRRAHYVRVVGRLRSGASLEQARVELEAVAARLEQKYPETNRLMGAGVTGLQEWIVGPTRLPLLVLLGAVGLLLLVACANVANLTLARAAERAREMAIRGALGASRGWLVRQGLAESLLLAGLGALAGLVLGSWGTEALVRMAPAEVPRLEEVRLDGRLLLFTAGAAMLSALLFGLVPALRGARPDLEEALKGGGRSGTQGRGRFRSRAVLVAAEVALALMLAVGAGLLIRSFARLRQVEPGFDPRGVLSAQVSLPGVRYGEEAQQAEFYGRLLERIEATPGVQAAGVASKLPLTLPGWSSDFSVEGRPAGEHGIEVVHRQVSPGYFRTLRVPLLRGRVFDASDRIGRPRVVLINEALARRHFGDEDPIGKRICFDRAPDEHSVWRTIVGVVGSEKQQSLALEARLEIFAPAAEEPDLTQVLVVRGPDDPLALVGTLREAVRQLDPEVPLYSVRTMEQVSAESLGRERFVLALLGGFAALALVLAALGVYGVTAYVTRQRTREIGIRMALGAGRAQVLGLVLRQGLAPVAAGGVAGVAGALGLTRLMQGLLFEVEPADPGTYVSVAALLAAAALVACLMPARRAIRVQPVAALRHE
jgi:putative ABC transport system permease protein